MTPERKQELLDIAQGNAELIIESWWNEIGSWDDYLEDEIITIEEFDWIMDHVGVSLPKVWEY